MRYEEFLRMLNIRYTGQESEDRGYVVDLPNSDAFGLVYTILDTSDEVEEIDDNQVVTEDGTSLQYQAIDEPFLIALLADWEKDLYQLVITNFEE